MRLLCQFAGDKRGVIVGYCPSPSGSPQAIIVTEDAKLASASLRDIVLLNAPKRQLKRLARLIPSDLNLSVQ